MWDWGLGHRIQGSGLSIQVLVLSRFERFGNRVHGLEFPSPLNWVWGSGFGVGEGFGFRRGAFGVRYFHSGPRVYG